MRAPALDRRWLLAGLGLVAVVITAVVLRQQADDPAPAPSPAPAAAGAVSSTAGVARSRCARVSDDALEAIGEAARPGVAITGPAFFVLTRGAAGRTWVVAARIESADRRRAGIWATRFNPGKTSGLIGPFIALDVHARRASAWPAEAGPRRLGPRPDGRPAALACLRAGRRV